jgi:uncharacterized protein (DUF2164 family)
MPLKLTKDQRQQAIASLGRYFHEKLEVDVSEMQAGFLLDYFLTEIAPFAYNQGVSDARRFLDEKMEDLPGSCFEHELTFWMPRKPGR